MIGIALGLSLLSGAVLGWPAVAAIAGILGIDGIARGGLRGWLGVAVGLAILGAIRVERTVEPSAPAWLGETRALVGTVTASPVVNGRSQQLVVSAVPEGFARVEPARICVTAPVVPVVIRGDRIALDGDVRRLSELPDATAGYLRYRGCAGTVYVGRVTVMEHGRGPLSAIDRFRRRLTDELLAAAPGDRGALLAGLATGDDASLSVPRRDAFVITGTSHVTAVSGSNLALLAAIVVVAGGRIGSRRSVARLTLVFIAVWGYIALVGFSPPAVRAGTVASLALMGQRIGRRPDFVTLSVLAAATELLIRPEDIGSLAFQLSTISAVALVLGLGGRSPHGVSGWFMHGVYATAVTQAATSAVLVPAFGRLALYAIPANIIVGPLCTAAFPLALATGLAGLASGTLAAAVAWPASVLAWAVLAAVGTFAEMPYAHAGAGLAAALPAWSWAMVGLGSVIALSREARGGIRRWLSRARRSDGRELLVWRAAAVGAAGGALAVIVVR